MCSVPCIFVFRQYFEHVASQHLITVEATAVCPYSLHTMLSLAFSLTAERKRLEPKTYNII